MENNRKCEIMIEITRIKIENWASVLKIENLILAEHDYRILFLLKDIYSHPFLSNRLCLKGGTAINKLFLKETSRLSIDLDFNIIGEKERVFKERKEIKGKLIEMLRRQKMEKIKVKSRYDELTVSGRYKPIFGEKQKIKLEISYIERIPILDPVEKEMKIPLGKIRVKTYRIEELLATKIRALYDRLKGRDIYDLYFSSFIDFDKILLKKLVLFYFYKSGKIFNPKIFFRNIEDKFLSEKFIDDVSIFIKPTTEFSIKNNIKRILEFYSFLKEFDEHDKKFILLAEKLLGMELSSKNLKLIKNINYPLDFLFDDLEISERARKMTIEEIKPMKKK